MKTVLIATLFSTLFLLFSCSNNPVTTTTTTNNSFHLIAPSNNTSFQHTDTITFSWSAYNGAIAYALNFGYDTSFVNGFSSITSATTFKQSLPTGAFYWRVIAYPDTTHFYFSDVRRITIN